MAPQSLVALADGQVSILEVCRQIGIDVPDELMMGRASMKVFCPQGDVFHGDGGTDPTFRIYSDTNSAYCFKCNKLFTPVSLYAISKGVTRTEAAKYLLEVIGFNYRVPELDHKTLLLTVDKPVDYAYLSDALKVYCGRICSDWETRQFSSEISEKLAKCLELLPRVKSKDEVAAWLSATKQVMSALLKEQ